jgi:hypothetical protein
MNLALTVKSENEYGTNEYSYTVTDLKVNLETLETHARSMFRLMDEQAQWNPPQKDDDDDDKPEFPTSAK